MRLVLTGRQVEITPTLRRMVERKIARLERVLSDKGVSDRWNWRSRSSAA